MHIKLKKRMISAVVMCLLSVFLFSAVTARVFAYTAVTALIPVSCFDASVVKGHVWKIKIEPENEYSPTPEINSIEIKEKGDGEFKINISEPGTYKYKIYEETEDNIKANIYDVTLYVQYVSEDELAYSVSAHTLGNMHKTEVVEFRNMILADEVVVTTTASEATVTTVTLSETSDTTSGTALISETSIAENTSSSETTENVSSSAPSTSAIEQQTTTSKAPVKEFLGTIMTGDNFNLRGLIIAMIFCIMTAVSAFLLKNNKREEDDDDV